MTAGVETVVLALRLGMCVFRVRELVEANGSSSPSWSVLVSGIREKDAQQMIEEFGQVNVSLLEIEKAGQIGKGN